MPFFLLAQHPYLPCGSKPFARFIDTSPHGFILLRFAVALRDETWFIIVFTIGNTNSQTWITTYPNVENRLSKRGEQILQTWRTDYPDVENGLSKRGEQIIQTWRTNSPNVDNELYRRG